MIFSFAIIGCGRIARRHAEQINKIGTVAAVCDIVYENALDLSQEYNANLYLSIEDLLENEPIVDVVIICTPNGLHAHHSILSLQAKKHVLCEKPLCINTADAKKMLRAAQDADRQLYIVKQNRYNPPVEAVKQLLKDDKLGKIFSFQINCFWNRPHQYYDNSWKGTAELDGGSLFTQFSHFIDLLYWFLGDVKKVQALTRNYHHPLIQIEDCGVVLLETVGGAIGTLNYTVNSYDKNMEGSFSIFGENGTVKIGGQYLNELEYQSLKEDNITDLPPGKAANSYGFYQGSMSNHHKVYENLLLAMKNPQHEFASAFEGMKTVEIIEKIYAAAGLK
ncbi:MAG: Gfo/Idh/MocA family oxidoreductase [Gloeobacteraceae cyanobacterium ES-bin-316]|nr:Gfo/Idh/MocA family oxidoreductase [Ferruginibacter sp.]